MHGTSINLLDLTDTQKECLAYDLANFVRDLHRIVGVEGPRPGQHNWWRGDHVSVYDKAARDQIISLVNIIDTNKALSLWERACATSWSKDPVWIHGDLAIGNILVDEGRLSGIIDFGGAAKGDPACDLVIAWTYLSKKSREIFFSEMNLDKDTWLRAKAWALWKSTFELCNMLYKNSSEALKHMIIIRDVIQ